MSIHVAPPLVSGDPSGSPVLYCDTCYLDPCIYPPFCRACRAADALIAAPKPTTADDLIAFAEYARQRADQWRSRACAKCDAVDAAYQFAVALGLPRKCGDDAVQRVLAAAFHENSQ
jgi:hypothetical protein